MNKKQLKAIAAEWDAACEAATPLADPISPCVSCRFAARCASDQLACDALTIFKAGLPEIRYRLAPRAPTRACWELLQQPRKPKPKPRRIVLPADAYDL
jgi:hypothetical protein